MFSKSITILFFLKNSHFQWHYQHRGNKKNYTRQDEVLSIILYSENN